MKVIALRPHVHAAGGERVFLRHRVVDGRSGNLWRADVFMAVEGPAVGPRLTLQPIR